MAIGKIFMPGNDGGIVKKVVNVLKTIWNLISNKPAKQLSETDSINDDSSLENIDRIVTIFSSYKEQVHEKALEIEAALKEEVDFYLEEIRNALEENKDISEKYGIRISRIERRVNKISEKINGCIDYEVSRKVSLDNIECKNIMKMIPGAKKEEAMSGYLNDAIRNALEVYCEELKSILNEIFEDVNEEIVGVVDNIQKLNDSVLAKISAIDAENYEIESLRIMEKAYDVISACDVVDMILQEV